MERLASDYPLFYIEPWWGWADSIDYDGCIENKTGILRLALFKKREFSSSLELH
ncbi:MAG: hypothetical protein FJZ80_09245 [Bacteroidetes bacterium]|nr:hypothetical protein [Bacteroidota bacterium]